MRLKGGIFSYTYGDIRRFFNVIRTVLAHINNHSSTKIVKLF